MNKTRLVLYFVITSCFHPTVFAQTSRFKEVLKKSSPSVIHILVSLGDNKQALGTGFVVDQLGTIITSAHVIDGAKAVYARFQNGKGIRCDLVDLDKDHDLAAIRLTDKDATDYTPLTLAAPDKEAPEALDELLLISDPSGLESTPTLGHFASIRRSKLVKTSEGRGAFQADFSLYQLNINATHGSSGGPVLDADGEVVGVLYGGYDDGRISLTFCIPHSRIHKLRLDGDAKPFQGSKEGPRLETSFAATKLDYDERQEPIVKRPDSTVVNFSSDHWGYVDPNRVGMFVDDWVKAPQLVQPLYYNQMVRTNRLLHIVNPSFRFSAVLLEKYRLSERVDKDSGVFTSTISDSMSGTSVTIRAQKIPQPAPAQLTAALAEHGRSFLNNELELVVAPQPLASNEVNYGPLSDPQPRVGRIPGTVKFWRQYFAHPKFDSAHMVMYAISGNCFITVHVPYRPSSCSPTQMPPDLVERMFIASTVSLIP